MILQKLRFKNFFSAGNAFVEFDLRKYPTAVISGKNGLGKSTVLSAITFGLFGKTIKQVSKPQIVNSINGKNCLVEIELSINSDNYLIKRGIKPNLFEIYKNSELVDQTSVNDYQDYLEENILGCSFRTFLQTSVISIENYKPFMSLTKAERRDFIEDILDIKVFTVMNQLVKAKIVKNKDELKLINLSLQSSKEKILLLKSHIDTLESLQKNSIQDMNKRLQEAQENSSEAHQVIQDVTILLDENNTELKTLKSKKQEKTSIESKINELKSSIRQVENQLIYLEENTNCPTCKKPFDSEESKVKLREKHSSLLEQKEPILEELKQYDGIDEQIYSLMEIISELTNKISNSNTIISSANKTILSIEKEKLRLENSEDILEQKNVMKELAKSAMALKEKQTEINTEQDYNLVMLELFKDSGIKSKIVEQYIPVINTLVNQYLDKLDFFVSFNLDSEFNEIIKSRHRDNFTYSSFSAGEKQRIDSALLFTFRQLAKMKNSFSCNLLALDELLDSSTDSDGIDLIMNILNDKEFAESNILVISHANKERFEDSFEGCYNVYKRDGFTEISEE